MKRYLETFLTLLILAVSGAVLWNLVKLNSVLGNRQQDSQSQLIGHKLSNLGDGPSAKRNTLVVFLSPTCRFCEESFDFYRRMASTVAKRDDIGIVVATGLPVEVVRDYVVRAKLGIENIIRIPPGSTPLNMTPTLLITDAQGVVRRSWVGKLSRKQESEVESVIFAR